MAKQGQNSIYSTKGCFSRQLFPSHTDSVTHSVLFCPHIHCHGSQEEAYRGVRLVVTSWIFFGEVKRVLRTKSR